MRIKSPFRDYYDGLRSYDNPLYIRETSRRDIHSSLSFRIREVGPKGRTVRYCPILVGFCDKIYPAFVTYNTLPGLLKVDKYVYYKIEDLIKNSKVELTKDEINSFSNCSIKYTRRDCVGFGLNPDLTKEYNQYFSAESPCFIIFNEDKYQSDTRTLEINPNLRSYEFYKLFDTVSAFQELEMYLGGLASPEKPIPYIPDEVMIEAKGFDRRYSFRKDASKCKK